MRIDDLASGAQSWPNAFVSAVLAGSAANDGLPDVLMYYPVAQVNPYQQLLYSEAEAHGLSVLPVLNLDDIGQVAWRDHAVIHLHWLSGILQKATTPDEADNCVAHYKEQLALWRSRGLRVVWTIHNIMPHRIKWHDAELALRRLTAEAADLIHVMNDDTERLVAPYFHLDPRKVVRVPHPSYGDWYANVVSTHQSRQDLGLEPDDYVFLSFGSIQPYKGLAELIDAYDTFRSREPSKRCVLLIAGQVDDEAYFAELRAKARGRQDIHLLPGNVRDQRVQVLFNACNVVVAPYLATLNSGVALLSATFRRMVVAPATGGMAEVFADDPTLLYADDQPDALAGALQRALRHRPPPGLFDDILARHDPVLLSGKFCTAVRKVLSSSMQESAAC